MSQQNKKILTAKRCGSKHFLRPINNPIPNNTIVQGIKRTYETDETDLQSSSKRLHRHNLSTLQSSSSSSINLASRRLENLRQRLEIDRRNLENRDNSKNILKCSSIQDKLKRNIIKFNEINQNTSNDENNFEEEMEWNEIDESTIINDILDLRKEINYNIQMKEAKELYNLVSFSTDEVFIVVDTNIFLSNLSLLTELREMKFKGFGQLTIMVPWMVIQELDYMKESLSSRLVTKAAKKAIHYINSLLMNKVPHFMGQSVMDASRQDISSENPDDGILFCCIQLRKIEKFTVLLSNDVNLRNKALVSEIQAFNSSDIVNQLSNLKIPTNSKRVSREPIQKIKILMSNLLTYIIEMEMKKAYGDIWLKMALMHPPFTTEEALECLERYWVSVFCFSLQKQCKMKIREFALFLKSHQSDLCFHVEDFNKLVEYCLSLCIYLKNGYIKYKTLVSECVKNIQQCAET